MKAGAPKPGPIRFGPFVLDPHSGDLRGNDVTQRLSEQPLALLNALLERRGEMVSREELRQRLWPDGTFVDFEHGLNSAVSRLREALDDSASTPRFLETIPRRGYRLLVSPEDIPRASTVGNRRLMIGLVTAALILAAATGLLLSRRGPEKKPLLASVVIDLPPRWVVLNESPAVSPDSRHIVFGALHHNGQRAIWLRALDAGAARLLPDTEFGNKPFWSPASDAIGFFAGGKLKTLPIGGDSARVVCDAPSESSGTWASSGRVLFAPDANGTVSAVDLAGGAVRSVSRLDRAAGDLRHAWPHWLADGRHFVYLAEHTDDGVAMLASIDEGRAVPLATVQSQAQPSLSEHVLFVRDRKLVAQRLDVAAGRLVGESTVLATGVTSGGRTFPGRFSASPEVLVYLKPERPQAQLRIFDRGGKPIRTVGEPAEYSVPSLSPDGARLAVARRDPSSPSRDIWVFDLVNGKRSQLTDDPGDDLMPKWSPDAKWLMFSSDRRGQRDIYRRLASGEGSDELVFASAISKSLNAWSPDGRFVVYDTGGLARSSELHVLPLPGDRGHRVLAAGTGMRQQADISPDGRWVAYASTESGRWEVIVEGFPQKGPVFRLTTEGGREPLWRGDGREIVFLSDRTLMAVDIQRDGAGLKWSAPRPLFEIADLESAPRTFSMSADGRLFVALIESGVRQQRLSTLLNWTALLK